jgi:hypothetical protein
MRICVLHRFPTSTNPNSERIPCIHRFALAANIRELLLLQDLVSYKPLFLSSLTNIPSSHICTTFDSEVYIHVLGETPNFYIHPGHPIVKR